MASVASFKKKLDTLKKLVTNDDDIDIVNGQEKRMRALVLQSSLMKNDAAQAVVADAKKRINSIATILSEDEDMTELERKLLFRERKVLKFYLTRFDPTHAENELKAMNEKLDRDIKIFSE